MLQPLVEVVVHLLLVEYLPIQAITLIVGGNNNNTASKPSGGLFGAGNNTSSQGTGSIFKSWGK